MVSVTDTLYCDLSIKSNRPEARSQLSGSFRPSTASRAFLSSRGNLPQQVRALAILVPQRRGYATEPSTSSNSGGPSYPPPGFNAEQARNPLKDTPQKPSDLAGKDAVKDAGKAVVSPDRLAGVAKSKIDEAALAELETRKSESEKKVAEEKKEAKKLTIGQKIKKEVQHYWDGTKLLATEVRISSKLALKMAAGYELSRRENRQVCTNQVILLSRSILTNLEGL